MGSALERVARRGTSLIIVTHHLHDLPACITHVAELRAGQIAFQGSVADFAFETQKSSLNLELRKSGK